MTGIVLASGSAARAGLLRQVGLAFSVDPARVDEAAIRAALEAEGAGPRDVADALAEFKARKVSERHPQALVIGCDQVLALGREILAKPPTRAAAADQLCRLRGRDHKLLSAVVLYRDGRPDWRFVGEARLTMKPLGDDAVERYLSRVWPGVADSVGGYKLEEEGARLFSRIEGDHFTILGLPLLELCSYLEARGEWRDE